MKTLKILQLITASLLCSTYSAHAVIVCPGFVVGSGSHYVSLTETSGKVRIFPIIMDSDDGTIAAAPHGKLIIVDGEHPTVTISGNISYCRNEH